jgi:LmbE family N-acetylglucosaminyl deacetylase
MKRLVLPSVSLLILSIVASAQMRVVPLDDERGHVALGLALRHLANTGILLHTTAHPDDENNGLLVKLNRGEGYRTALATATRGNGGQNEIGPELFEALGVLRTEELAALHRFDGAEQYFTRAVDFGFSFSIDETYEKWGKDEITGDFVRLIRTVRPDVVITLFPSGAGGGQHHQAAAVLTHDAVKVSGDPAKYPEQLRDGLRPWQPKKFYYFTGFGPLASEDTGNFTRTNLAVYDPLLGKTYAEIGTESRSMHKCQGMAQLLALPGPASTAYRLVESTISGAMQREDRDLFDGVDHSIEALAAFAGPQAPKELTDALSSIASAVADAQKKFDGDVAGSIETPLLAGLRAVRNLRVQLGRLPMNDGARFEIDFRLRQKEAEFQRAILVASGLEVEALADDGVVVPGQPVKVSVFVANRGGTELRVKDVHFDGFEGGSPCALTAVTGSGAFGSFGGGRGSRGAAAPAGPPLANLKKDTVGRCDPTLTVPANARVTEPYWHRKGEEGRYSFDRDAPFGLPYRPTPFAAQITFTYPDGQEVVDALPVQYRYEGNIFSGEKRMDLLVAPAVSVRASPEIAIIPAASVAAARSRDANTRSQTGSREVRVTVVNDTPSATDVDVTLDVPAGWAASPPNQSVNLAREDEARTVRFDVRPAAGTPSGEYHVRAVATAAGRQFDRGYQVIEYPHIRRQHIYHSSETTIKVVDVRTTPNLTIGYVMGVGDEVPPAIEQLDARVELLGADDLAWGNLSRFDAIVTGVRAYERREDLRANNSRLLDYVRNGGVVIVQYNKFEFNQAQYGPYPAKVSQDRVTDENSPVRVLAPDDPLLGVPNRIGDAAWKGWVQDRGLYFLGERDPRYHDLVELQDPYPYNSGPKTGALVEATYGRGRWVYVGLALWRQLPAGVDGAYQILANLISLGKAAVSTGAAAK